MSNKRKLEEADTKEQPIKKQKCCEWIQTDTKEFIKVNAIIGLKLSKTHDTNEAKISFVLNGGIRYTEYYDEQNKKLDLAENLFYITGNDRVMKLISILDNEDLKREYNKLFRSSSNDAK